MRIGIDARGIYKHLDGVGRYSFSLIRHLAQIDPVNAYVVFRNRGCDQPIVVAPNFREVQIGFPALSLRSILYLGHLVKREGLDLFHSLFPVTPLHGVRNLMVTVHDVMALNFPGFFSDRGIVGQRAAYYFHKQMIRQAVRRSRTIIAVSHNTKKDLVDLFGIDPDKIQVIHEATESRFTRIHEADALRGFRETYHLPERFILYLGNAKPYKNLAFLVNAFNLLRQRYDSGCKLVIAGKRERYYQKRDRHYEALNRQVQTLGIGEHVQMVDYVPDEKLPLLYNAADLFVFPSLYEGFGLPALEAISCGTPTIVSKTSSLPEVVGNGALLIDPYDVEELAETMRRLLTDEPLRSSLCEKGLAESRQFSWERAARETLELYRTLSDMMQEGSA
jgi:glycosyltransferase involved in cell wall biosynthesis